RQPAGGEPGQPGKFGGGRSRQPYLVASRHSRRLLLTARSTTNREGVTACRQQAPLPSTLANGPDPTGTSPPPARPAWVGTERRPRGGDSSRTGRVRGGPGPGRRPGWSSGGAVGNNDSHERRRLRQADPRSGRAGVLGPRHEEPGPRGKAHPGRLG